MTGENWFLAYQYSNEESAFRVWQKLRDILFAIGPEADVTAARVFRLGVGHCVVILGESRSTEELKDTLIGVCLEDGTPVEFSEEERRAFFERREAHRNAGVGLFERHHRQI